MAFVTSPDGVKLYVEDSGAAGATPVVPATPVLFVHELAGSCRSFDLQLPAFRGHHRCITFNARGYPPSDVPERVASYSQDLAASDIIAVLDGLAIDRAHLVGVSMGSAAVLQAAIRHPGRVLSATLASIGSYSDISRDEQSSLVEANAREMEARGMAAMARVMAEQPSRRRLAEKNPAEGERFIREYSGFSLLGSTNTMRGVQKVRPPLYVHEAAARALRLPVLIVVGDEDEMCVKPSVFLAGVIPDARMETLSATGHMVNLEEPDVFNQMVMSFIAEAQGERAGSAGR
jgi:pimeloyl-ACP methyl ester carboxylesterase